MAHGNSYTIAQALLAEAFFVPFNRLCLTFPQTPGFFCLWKPVREKSPVVPLKESGLTAGTEG